MACICLSYVLLRASYEYNQCGFIPSVVWRLSNVFSSSFRGRKLALTRDIVYLFEFIKLPGMLGVVRHFGISDWGHPYVPPYICTSPYISIHPSHTPICHRDIGGICTFLCLSVHPFVHQFIPVAQHLYGSLAVSCMSCSATYVFWVLLFLLCWTRSLWMYAQTTCCCLVLFLCSVFIMSQVFATMAMTTSPPVTVVCSGTSSHLMTVTMAPLLDGATSDVGSA